MFCSFTPGETVSNMDEMRSPICSPFALGSGGKRTRTSRELPKSWTCAFATPALESAERSASTSGIFSKWVSTTMPPVKSTPRLKPRTNSSTNEAMIRKADKPYHTLRVRMNGKVVTLWKNSMLLSS